MGKIPLYEQGQLPSARVGIVGTDKTGDIVSGIGQDAATLTQQLISVQKAKNEIADNIETERYKLEYGNKVYAKHRELQEKYAENTNAILDSLPREADKIANDMAQNIGNSRVKAQFLSKATPEILNSEMNRGRSWTSETTTKNAGVNLGISLDHIGERAGGIKDPKELLGLIKEAEQTAQKSVGLLGLDGANKYLEVAKKDIAEGFIYARGEEDPKGVEKLIDSGFFNPVLDAKEQHEMKSSLHSMADKQERERKEQLHLQNSKIVNDLFDKSITGKGSLRELNTTIGMLKDQMEREKKAGDISAAVSIESDIKSVMVIKRSYINEAEQDAKANAAEGRAIQRENTREQKAIIREQKAEQHRLTSISTMMGLNKDYDKLFNGKGVAYGDDSIKDIKALQNKTITAYKKGLITQGEAKKHLQASQKGMDALIKAPVKTGWFNAPVDDYNAGRKTIKDYADKNFTDPKLKDAFYSDAMENYMTGFDRESKKKNFKVNSYTSHLINAVAPDYGKSTQVRKK